METLLAFLAASAVTFFFVRKYLRGLAQKRASLAGVGSVDPASSGASCPRCGRPVSSGVSFCPGCGASMALWNVHRAAVQGAQDGTGKGKPRPVVNASLCIGCGSCVDACPESGTLAMMYGKSQLVNPERCVGHARCVTVCPTSAITLTFDGVAQTMRVPFVKENFETNVAGVYIVGELSGMGLIKTAINEGRLAVDEIRKRIEEEGAYKSPEALPSPAPDGELPQHAAEAYDVVIVGAGPAGLSASLTAQQHGLRYVTIEQGEIASTIRNYPRHKFLMAEPIEMPLYGTLYVGDGTKEHLLRVWEAIVANTGVEIRTNERVESIARSGDRLRVETTKAEYVTRSVVLALGKRGTPRKLGVPGEDLGKVAYGLIEADSYSDADILVVGGGDSALEAALALSRAGKNRVTLSYRGTNFEKARDRNTTRLAEAEQAGRVRVLRESQLKEIRTDSVEIELPDRKVNIPNRYVFILIGGVSPDDFLMKVGIQIVEKVIAE